MEPNRMVDLGILIQDLWNPISYLKIWKFYSNLYIMFTEVIDYKSVKVELRRH